MNSEVSSWLGAGGAAVAKAHCTRLYYEHGAVWYSFLCGCHLEEDSCVLCIGEEVKVKRTPLYFKNELPPQNASQLPNINIEANSSNYSHSIWCHEVNLFSVFDLLSPESKTRLFLECFLSFFWRNRSMVTFIVHTHQHSSESWTPIPMMMQLVANNLRPIHSLPSFQFFDDN